MNNQASLMTTAELLALPDDGVDRWLYRGRLRENGSSLHGHLHAAALTKFGATLLVWSETQSSPQGDVLCGNAGFEIEKNPDTTVGIDVAYVSPETLARQVDRNDIVRGIPKLAVEILEPHDVNVEIVAKIELYLNSGVSLVWIVDPRLATIVAHERGKTPILFGRGQTLTAEPHLPGFAVAVSKLFD